MESLCRVAFLKTVSIFSESPESLLRVIADKLVEMEVAEGEHIVLKGELGDAMYIIADGRVKVHDEDYIFSVLKKGDVFGKYYLLDKKERSATVTALSHSYLFRFSQELFNTVTRNESTVITGVLKTLVDRLRYMNIAEEQLAAQNRLIATQKEELEKQKKELIELNATKDKFFSIIAHDLRSPISTLVSLCEILRTDADLLSGKETHEILFSLHDLSGNYLKLLDNLLQWASIQTGKIMANPEKFSVVRVIDEVIGFYKILASSKQVNLHSAAEGDINVFADKNMIRTVLRNLVSNALKYTNMGGTVALGVTLLPDMIEVYVKDSGIGMDAETVEKLFKLDQTFSTVGTANEQGTGLGLILCKEFIEKNNGSIHVDSEPGKGSTFRFTLPLSE